MKYCLSLLIAFTSVLASAQEDSLQKKAKNLDAVVIVPQLSTISIVKLRYSGPYSGTYYDSDELKLKSTGQEPSFFLASTPSINCYSDAGNTQGYSYFRIRGIDQTRINFTLDGVPMNEPEDQGAYFSNYPDLLNSLASMHVQRGVGTTQNGTASFGGSIQLLTPRVKDSSKTTIGAGYGSYNSYRVFVEHGSKFKSGNDIYVRASQVQSDGYKYHSGNNSQSIFLQGRWGQKKSKWKATFLGGQQRNQLAWLGVSDSLLRLDRRTNANENEKDHFVQALTSVNHSYDFKNYSTLSTTVYHTFLDGNYDFNLNSYLGQPGTDELYNYAFKSNLIGLFSTYSFRLFKTYSTFGGHINTYNRSHTGSEKSLGELYHNNGYKSECSLFSKIYQSFGKFSFSADIQFRYVNFDYEGEGIALKALNWNFLNTKTILKYRFKDHEWYYSFANIGREPTRNDIFGGSDYLMVDIFDQPMLFIQKAEYALDHELGYRITNDKTLFSVNLYAMYFNNEIVLNGKFGPNGLALTNNVDKSLREGIELSFKYSPKKWLLLNTNASYNYSVIRSDTVNLHPILTPPLLLNQEVVLTKNGWSLAVDGRFQDKSFLDFANTSEIDGFFLLNARIGYVTKHFDVNLYLYNLANTRYYSNGYVDFDGTNKYFVQAPLNYSVSVKYTF